MIKIHISDELGKRRMTQKELAKATKIRPNTILELYHDLADKITFEQMNAICEAFDCQPGDLFEWVPGEQPCNKPLRRTAPKRPKLPEA